jgi:hypothetical protein
MLKGVLADCKELRVRSAEKNLKITGLDNIIIGTSKKAEKKVALLLSRE